MLPALASYQQKIDFFQDEVTIYPVSCEPLANGRTDIEWLEEVLAGECLLPLPSDEMGYYEGSMAEPISCIYSAQQRNYHIIKKGPHAQRQPQLGLLPVQSFQLPKVP